MKSIVVTSVLSNKQLSLIFGIKDEYFVFFPLKQLKELPVFYDFDDDGKCVNIISLTNYDKNECTNSLFYQKNDEETVKIALESLNRAMTNQENILFVLQTKEQIDFWKSQISDSDFLYKKNYQIVLLKTPRIVFPKDIVFTSIIETDQYSMRGYVTPFYDHYIYLQNDNNRFYAEGNDDDDDEEVA